MRIKQNVQGVFGVYNIVNNSGEERLCVQLNNIRLNKFYMGISGVDQNGKCETQITNLSLFGTERY